VGTPTNTSGNTWRFPVSGLVTGSLDLSLAPDADDILDPAGNDVAPPVNWSLTVDTVARNVALIVDPAGGCAVIDTLGTKNVSGYEITSPSGQLVPAGWTPTGLSGWEVLAGTATSLSEANFTGSSAFTGQLPIGSLFTIGGTQDLTFSWIDDASNLYTSAVYYQDLAPVVLSVTPAGGFSTNLSAIDVDVTFSEAVTGVDSTDLALSGGAAGGAAVGTPTNTAGNTWRFPVSGLVTGTLNLSLAPDAGDIVEASGGSLYVANKTWSYTIDTTPPTATVTPADGALLNSATIDIDVSFGEAVTGVQAADLVLAGAAAAGASVGTPVNTSGNTWRFPVSGLTDGDLDASIASGAITDLAGNNYAGFANSYTVDLTARRRSSTPAPPSTLPARPST
jgi:hypothetical protein